jgi:hypothetical protein
MLETHQPSDTAEVAVASQRSLATFSEALLWGVGIVLAFGVPLILTLGAILVSSYGIPLPIEVRVP